MLDPHVYNSHFKTSALPACFLKHPCIQCNSPLHISFISLETFLLWFNVTIPNPVIFLPIINFTLITRHNIMTYNLELHAIAIRCCFHVWQPHVLFSLMTSFMVSSHFRTIPPTSGLYPPLEITRLPPPPPPPLYLNP